LTPTYAVCINWSLFYEGIAIDLSASLQQIARTLGELEAALAGLVDALTHTEVALDIEPAAKGSPIRRACEAYSAIDYRMEDEVGTSVVCLGVIGASTDILRRAKAVNVAKAHLKSICAPLHKIRTRIPVKGEASPTRAIPVIRVILRTIQRSDLNLLAAYRKIPLLDAPPISVTYTRANTRSVYRKPVDEIYGMLSNSEALTASADRARLETLDRRETHLALVKERYQNIRANVVFAHLDPRGRGRRQITAELPLLYAHGRRTELPQVRFPCSAEDSPLRERRSQIDAAPFLQSIPVFRYAR
jgi:hypothetical protein